MSHFAFDEAPIYLLSFVPAESVPLRSFQCPCVQTMCTFCTPKVYILVTAPSNLLACAIALQAPPHGLPGLALGTLLFILFLRSYREWGESTPAAGAHTSRSRIAYAMAALMLFLPLLFAADGCGGGSTPAPTAQKSLVVTPNGTSTLVITPTTANASGKALQMPLIQLTLTVN